MTRTTASVFARLITRVALPIAAIVALSACAGGTTGYAFVFDGEARSQASVDKELRALADNEQFQAAIASGSPTESTQDGVLPATVTAAWLNVLVQYATIDQAVAESGISVTDEDRGAATQQAIQLFGTEQIWNGFPTWFRDRVITREARKVAFVRTSLTVPSEEELLTYFFENAATLCESGVTVSHILVADEAAAQEIVDGLDDGADFTTLAAERSTDASGTGGGVLGCLVPGTFVPEFETAALGLEPGTYSGPVESEFGWHVIRVEPVTFASLRNEVAAAVQQETAGELTAEVDGRLERADLEVNPRYGRIDRSGGSIQIVPPTEPEVRREPTPSVPDVTVPVTPPQPTG
ncbi:MAG TPA: peptidylprolyl isomerase [Acidimicrobiia bacterium]|nr:peptidylprolyl isomerase [Acidimicrobiia bacterium]